MSLNKVNKETGDLTPVAGTYVPNAGGITYDNTESGLTSGNVQNAINEVNNKTQFCKSITNDTGSDIWCKLYCPVGTLSTDSITFTLTAGKGEEYKLILSIVSGGTLQPIAAQVTRVADAWNQTGQNYHGFAIDKFVWHENGFYIHVIHNTTVRVTQTTATEDILPFDFTIMPAPVADAYVIPIKEMPPSFDYMNMVRSSNWAKMGEKYGWQPGFLRQGRLPRKVVVIGNSMTYHGPASYWEVNDLREMAASTPTSGWVSLVYKELKKYFPNIVMYKANGAPWETAALGSRAFSNIANQSVALMTDSGCEATSLTLSDVLTSDVDIVISQLYENIPDVSASEVGTLAKDYGTLYNSILARSPNAFLYQFCGFWQTLTKHRAVLYAIQNRGEPIYAPCLNPYNTGVGQSGMTYNKHSFFEAQTGDNIYDSSGNIITTVTSTVAGHPNDLGFKTMAAHVICHLYNQYGSGDSGKIYPQFKPRPDGVFDLDSVYAPSELFFANQAGAVSSDVNNVDWMYRLSHSLYNRVFDFLLLAGIYRLTLNFESPSNAQHSYLRTNQMADVAEYTPVMQEICSCNSSDKFSRSVTLSASDTVFTVWLPSKNKFMSVDGANYYTGEIYNGSPVKRLCIIPTSDLDVVTNDWRAVPGSVAAFDSHPNTVLRTSTVIGVDADTLPRDPFNVVGIRFTLPGAATAVRVASLAEYKWVADKPLFVDYI